MLHDVGRHGELRLTFARRADKTVLVQNYSRPPLQVMRPISDAAGCLCVYLLSPTGGIVQGDHYALTLDVGEGTHALFTTQSATKIYRMPEGCAEQITHVAVGEGAVFEYVPDAAILFADADYQQRMEVRLEAGALALLVEMVMPGRLARGERLQFRRYASRCSVRDTRGLLLYDAARIEPEQRDLDSIGRLEGYSCWANYYVVGDLVRYGIDPARFEGLVEREDAIAGLSLLRRNGFAVKALSRRMETLYALLNDLRAILRTDYLKLPHAPLRK